MSDPSGRASETQPANERSLLRAALAVAAVGGPYVFDEIAKQLAGILGVDVALIAVFKEDDPSMMRTLGAVLDGRLLQPFEYALAGTPCERVTGHAFLFVERGAAGEFAPNTVFGAKRIDGYAGYPVNDADGRPLGLLAVMNRAAIGNPVLVEATLKIFAARVVSEIERMRHDLERAEADRALRESEQSYRAIFEAVEDPIFVLDRDSGAIVDANPKARTTYGWRGEALPMLPLRAFATGTAADDDADARAWLDLARAGGLPRYEWQSRRRDGSIHWEEVSLKSVTIDGNPRIVAVMREITRRKLAEEALRASEEQYRAIYNVSLDAIILWDAQLRMVDANPAYFQMYRARREDVIGKTPWVGAPEGVRAERESVIRRTLAGESCQMETVARRKTGEAFLIEVRTVPVSYRGEPHAIVICRDITERKAAETERARLEGQLRQAQKMEAIGHLAGGIAHDFNNMLTGILGYVVLAAERAEARRDAKLADYLGEAQAACRRARDLIAQLLTFSRGRRGERRALALDALLSEARTLVRSALPPSIELDVELDAVPAVFADRVQIEQVILNLAINARDAMEGAGRIALGVRKATVAGAICTSCRDRVDGRFVELFLRDQGPGIPSAILERIFEPFFSTKDVGKGSGMGLAVVHGIVHDAGGHLLVESAPGRGANFRVLLPVAQDAEASLEAAVCAADRAALKRLPLAGRVLVVDDEPAVATFMKELLETWGLAVSVAHDPLDALERLRISERFDLVITDQTMPHMSGIALAREIGKLLRPSPVILYTGYADDVGVAQMRAVGIEHLVRKPIEPAELREIVAGYLACGAPTAIRRTSPD